MTKPQAYPPSTLPSPESGKPDPYALLKWVLAELAKQKGKR